MIPLHILQELPYHYCQILHAGAAFGRAAFGTAAGSLGGPSTALRPADARISVDDWTFGSVSKPCTPVVHSKIAGIYGCSSH